MVDYPNPIRCGTDALHSLGDGYTINVSWFQALHIDPTNKIAYHIYYSTVKEDVFLEGPKYVSIDGYLNANLIGLDPGQNYYIAVRPVEYDPVLYDLTQLPVAYDNLRFYPTSMLRQNITATSLIIPLLGVELIQYTSVDQVNNNLIVPAPGGGTPSQIVDQDGYSTFFTPLSGNVGIGGLSGLALVPSSQPLTEDWTIRCTFVQRDVNGDPVPETAQFITIGSISGTSRDGYGNPIIWTADGPTNDNGILSFAITETGPEFREGDGFLVKVNGATPGLPGGRGFAGTQATSHTVGGYDGYNIWPSTVPLFADGEDTRWDRIFVCQSRFEYPNYAYTTDDGYHQVTKDILSTDLTAADESNVDFPTYDYAGYHRTDPVLLLDGTCVGSYIGGEMGCIDKYGNYNIVRGLSLQDQNNQRQEILLSVTGRPAVLVRRVHTGITCSCYLPSSEYPDDRCPRCYGTKFVFGYEQYFNPRRSDGRILVRPGPTAENLKMHEAGLESEFPLDLWTLTVPTIKTRDVLIMFDQDDNEEFRYEVADVTRNNTIVGLQGGQHLKVFRIRKTDPAYQIRAFRNTAMFPSKLNTSIGMVTPGIPPHTHEIVINENIMSVSQINQTTGISQGHNHPIVNGQVMEALGHTHTIILP
jgi:hypothetical protein